MDDRNEIEDVLIRYATGIDSRDWPLFKSCFVEDCELDYGFIGCWSNRESVTKYMIRAHSGPSLHRISNISVEVNGEKATARSYVDAIVLVPGGVGNAQAIGYYDDKLVRTQQGWQIEYRSFTHIRIKLLGLLSIIPSRLVQYLTAMVSKKLNASA